VETPLGVAADIKLIDPRESVAVVPILRAGLVPIEKAQEVLPVFDTFHIGYVRDEQTLQPTLYLNKLPEQVH
jgi:uracil phosphoribosyltransferase